MGSAAAQVVPVAATATSAIQNCRRFLFIAQRLRAFLTVVILHKNRRLPKNQSERLDSPIEILH
jgi:hypothetical protein